MVVSWDPRKAVANARKHGVGFREAVSALEDGLSTTFADSDSHDERRFLTVGLSSRQRLLVVCHTDEARTIRIISARRATRRERSFYEEGA
jgi:uncharacterized protein